MKKYKVRCNICGCINKINSLENFKCQNCLNDIKVDNCYIKNNDIRSEEYYLYQLKIAIINNDNDKQKENALKLKNLSSKNLISKYCLLEDKEKIDFLLNSKEDNSDEMDIIIKYLIINRKDITNDVKMAIINRLKNKDEYLEALVNEEKDNSDLLYLKNEIVINDLYKEKKKAMWPIYVGIIVFSFIFGILTTIISAKTIIEDCLYAVIVLIDIFPAFLIAISVNKLIRNKKFFYSLLLFIIIFFVFSYLMTIPYHEGSFFVTIKEHLMHMLLALKDVFDAINSQGVPDGWGER